MKDHTTLLWKLNCATMFDESFASSSSAPKRRRKKAMPVPLAAETQQIFNFSFSPDPAETEEEDVAATEAEDAEEMTKVSLCDESKKLSMNVEESDKEDIFAENIEYLSLFATKGSNRTRDRNKIKSKNKHVGFDMDLENDQSVNSRNNLSGDLFHEDEDEDEDANEEDAVAAKEKPVSKKQRILLYEYQVELQRTKLLRQRHIALAGHPFVCATPDDWRAMVVGQIKAKWSWNESLAAPNRTQKWRWAGPASFPILLAVLGRPPDTEIFVLKRLSASDFRACFGDAFEVAVKGKTKRGAVIEGPLVPLGSLVLWGLVELHYRPATGGCTLTGRYGM